jgi:RHS repeat-associated protein
MNNTVAAAAKILTAMIHYLCRIVLLVLLLVIRVSAQDNATSVTDGSTPLGLSPGAPAGSYALSGFDNINPYNGSLNFRLPLLQIGGRGGAQHTITLPIEIHWRVDRIHNGLINKYYATPNGWATIEPGYGPGVLVGRLSDSGLECGEDPNHPALIRLTFIAGDGTEYELRDKLYGGQPLNNSYDASCNIITTYSRGKVFVTADGTAVTFISDNDISDYYGQGAEQINPSGYLFLRDGTTYRIVDGSVSWIRDRNGNQITFTYNVYGVRKITDSLKREVNITYAAQTGNQYDEISYKGFDGATGRTRTIRVWYGSLGSVLVSGIPFSYKDLFPQLDNAVGQIYNPPDVVSAVELPDGRKYFLRYNQYRELSSVLLPTGGRIEYDFGAGLVSGFDSGVFGTNKQIYRRVLERRIYPDGATLEGRMTYSRPEDVNGSTNTGYVVIDHLNANGGLLSREKHYYYGSPRDSFIFTQPNSYPEWKDGREYKTEIFKEDGGTLLQRVIHTWEQRASISWWTFSADQAPPNDPRIIETNTTLAETNQTTRQTFTYDQYNNKTDTIEYDYGSGGAGPERRHTQVTYLSNPTYTAADAGMNINSIVHLRSLPARQSVYGVNSFGNKFEIARTTYEYDNYNPDANHAPMTLRSGISGHDSINFGNFKTARGNVTALSRLLDTQGRNITTYQQYDIAGNLVKAIDPKGNSTTIDYSDRYGSPNGNARSNTQPAELGAQVSYALPTMVTRTVNGQNYTSYTKYNYYLGKPVDGEDPNGVKASGYYNDLLDRPTQIVRAVGLSVSSQTSFFYDDIDHSITTSSDLSGFNDNRLKSRIIYDGLGRTIETRNYESLSAYITTEQNYDAMGRVKQVSNPYRPGETINWTTTEYDALGRVIRVILPGGAVIQTVYSGNQTTVTDPAGKLRRSVTDGLGRLVSVVEDPGGLGYQTSYSYNALDNLIEVRQGVQTRTFTYDSLSRLIRASYPEIAGQISYSYDDNGNLTQKTDPRSGFTTTYQYDALNRVTSRIYTGSTPTPAVTYTYDSPAVAYSKGRLISISSSVSSYYFDEYDALGRVKRGRQVMDSQSYEMSYEYDLAGNLISETYPSGRIITTSYDSAGRISGLSGQKPGEASKVYASSISYEAHGGVSSLMLGNGLWEHTGFNKRLQPEEIGLGVNSSDSSRLKLNYSYGLNNNNGNVLSQTVTIGATVMTQNYSYDSLNRLTGATETGVWAQNYDYDRYGNRAVRSGSYVPNPVQTPMGLAAFDVNSNRLTGGLYQYDTAGNLERDNAGNVFAYDAENHQVSYNNGSATYHYDGDGRRVKTVVSGTTRRMIYDAGGKLIAEYTDSIAPASPAKEYVYRGGSLALTIEASQATALPPQITSLTPVSAAQGSNISLRIDGTDLSNASAVTFNPSTGISVTNISSASSSVTATVAIAATTPTGVTAVSVATPGGISNQLTFSVTDGTTVPSAPTELSAVAVSSTEVNLSWRDNSANESNFLLERATAGGLFSLLATLGPNVTSYPDSTAQPSTFYSYRIRAANTEGTSVYSNTATVTTPAQGGALPNVPSELGAVVISSTRVDLSWNDNSTNETNYVLERATGSGGFGLLETLSADATTYVDTTVEASTAYTYRIKATNSAGSSLYSNIATITTPSSSTPPAAPTNLTAVAINSNRVDLAWTDNSGDETEFVIERAIGSAEFVLLATVGANVGSHTDSTAASTTYRYRVKATNAAGSSSYSNTVSVTTPGVSGSAIPSNPSELKTTAVSETEINLSWKDNSTNEIDFVVMRAINTGPLSELAVLPANSTSYTDNSVVAATTYRYIVEARNQAAITLSNTITVVTPGSTTTPPAPTNLTVTSIGTTKIILSWTDNSTDELNFVLERSMENGPFVVLATLGPNVKTYSDTPLEAYTFCSYRVKAVNYVGSSDFSNTVSARTLEGDISPLSPNNLTATAVSETQVDLSWQDNANNETDYTVERAINTGAFSQLAVLPKNFTSYTDSSVSAGTTYKYRISARNPVGIAPSNTATVVTPGSTAVPAVPTNLTVTSIGITQINLSWTDNSTDELNFVVERSMENGPFTVLATLNQNVRTYSDTGLEAYTFCSYRVKAVNSVGSSDFSNTVSARTAEGDVSPSNPGNLTATALSETRVDLSWQDNSNNETDYTVERAINTGTFSQLAVLPKNSTSYTDSTVSAGTTYKYRISARNPVGIAPSNTATVVTPGSTAVPAAPTNLTATAMDMTRINLSWTDNSTDELNFVVERSMENGPFTVLATLGLNVKSYSDTGLEAYTFCSYRVRALNSVGSSNFSNTASARTAEGDVTPLSPNNLTATVVSSTRVDMTWQDNAGNETDYIVERTIGTAAFTTIAVIAKNSTAYSDTTASPATTYKYRVSARNPAGIVPSNTVTVTTPASTAPPDAPSNLTATAVSSTRVDLAWTDNSGDENNFIVERATGTGSFTTIATLSPNVTTYSNTATVASTSYTYRIRATNSIGNSYSNTATVITPGPAPSAPTSLTATAANSSQINLSWTDNSTNETEFVVERTENGSFVEVATLGANVTTYSDTAVTSTLSNTYRVKAKNLSGSSTYSNSAIVPASPTDLSATVVSSTRVDLSWTDNSSDEANFVVERATGTGPFATLATLGANVTSYSNTTVGAGITYSFRVKAKTSTGNSIYTSTVTVTTPATPPAAPSGLTATVISSTQVNLAWTDNSTNETEFVVERSDGTGFVALASIGANTTSYSDTTAISPTAYSYRVKAVNSGSSSPYSNSVTLLAGPSNLSATVISSTRVDLAWADNSTDEANFVVERATGTGSFATLATLGANVTSYSNTTATAGTTYSYRVKAKTSTASSLYTNPVTVTTIPNAPSAPTNLTATGISSTQIDLSWTDSATNESGFVVERLDGASYVEIATVGANTSSYSDATATSATSSSYRVKAVNGGGSSAYSNIAIVPAAPTNFSATVMSSTKVLLEWTDNSSNESNFVVERATGTGAYAVVATLAANVTNYTNTTSAGTTYNYRVRAKTSTGNSVNTVPVTVTTPATSPVAPTNTRAAALSATEVKVLWTDKSSNEAGFVVERSESGSAFAVIGSVGANTISYTDTTTTLLTTYGYRVKATDSGGGYSYSNTIQITPTESASGTVPAAPSSLTASALSSTVVNLYWVDNSTSETGVVVERSTGGSYTAIANLSASSADYADVNVSGNTSYSYRVKAINSAGSSVYSNTITVTTPDPLALMIDEGEGEVGLNHKDTKGTKREKNFVSLWLEKAGQWQEWDGSKAVYSTGNGIKAELKQASYKAESNGGEASSDGGENVEMEPMAMAAGEVIRYITTDQLGSVRVVTDENGAVVSRHDYLPFGEEIPASIGARTAQMGYDQLDGIRQKFTGKERDDETGLDFFEARYYSSSHGRFTTTDEFTGGPDELYDFTDVAATNPTFYADIANPQSLNKYQYCYNNPLSYVDPDGHIVETLWDAANVALGVKSFVDNVKQGNYKAAALDAVGVVADTAATLAPFIPAGAGAVIKGVRAADKLADAAKAANKADDAADSAKILNRKEAFNQAKDRAGVPRSQSPSEQYVIGGDSTRKGQKNYSYDKDPNHQGRQYVYDTPQGKRVVTEHTKDPRGTHFHAGQPKGNPNRKNVDFKSERYGQVGGRHHIDYKKKK